MKGCCYAAKGSFISCCVCKCKQITSHPIDSRDRDNKQLQHLVHLPKSVLSLPRSAAPLPQPSSSLSYGTSAPRIASKIAERQHGSLDLYLSLERDRESQIMIYCKFSIVSTIIVHPLHAALHLLFALRTGETGTPCLQGLQLQTPKSKSKNRGT